MNNLAKSGRTEMRDKMKSMGLAGTNFFELRFVFQKLYPRFLEPVYTKYDISKVELDVLLFLANNPQYDTAKEVVELRNLTKSHVSIAVNKLEERGYIERYYKDGNHKTVHISLKNSVMPIIEDGRMAQQNFMNMLNRGISNEENEMVEKVLKKVVENAQRFQEDGDFIQE